MYRPVFRFCMQDGISYDVDLLTLQIALLSSPSRKSDLSGWAITKSNLSEENHEKNTTHIDSGGALPCRLPVAWGAGPVALRPGRDPPRADPRPERDAVLDAQPGRQSSASTPPPLAIGSVHLYLGSNADCPPTGGKGRFDGRANLEHDALRLPEGRLYSIAKEDTGTYPYLIDLGEEEQREFLARIESSAVRKAGEGPFYSSYPILRVLYVMSTGELMEMTLDCTEEPGDILCSLGYAAGSGETGCVTSEPEWLLFQDENFYAFLSRYLKTNDPGAPELQNVAHAQAINHRDWHTVIPLSDGATELLLGVIDANAVIEGGEKRSFVSEFSIELDDGRIIRGIIPSDGGYLGVEGKILEIPDALYDAFQAEFAQEKYR